MDNIWHVSIIKPSKGLGRQNIYKLVFGPFFFVFNHGGGNLCWRSPQLWLGGIGDTVSFGPSIVRGTCPQSMMVIG